MKIWKRFKFKGVIGNGLIIDRFGADPANIGWDGYSIDILDENMDLIKRFPYHKEPITIVENPDKLDFSGYQPVLNQALRALMWNYETAKDKNFHTTLAMSTINLMGIAN
jgi:hypothetical protein